MALIAFVVGGALIGLAMSGVWPDGVVPGVCTILVMPSAGVMMTWREERGVWMACILTGGIALVLLLMFLVGVFWSAVRGGASELSDGLTMAGAMLPLMLILWLSGKQGLANWWLFRDGGATPSRFPPPSPPPEGTGVPSPRKPRPPELSAQAVAGRVE